MSDVCLLHAVLLVEAFEARLDRPLTPEERDDVYRLATPAAADAAERELARAADAGAALIVLHNLRHT